MAGNGRLRRPHRSCRIHATRPGRSSRLDHQGRLPRRPRSGATRSRASGRTTGDVSRLHTSRSLGRDPGGTRLCPAFISDGAGALRSLRALRRPGVDAGHVLRHRLRCHRHHRALCLQTDQADSPQRQTALGNFCSPRHLDCRNLTGKHLARRPRRRSRPRSEKLSAASPRQHCRRNISCSRLIACCRPAGRDISILHKSRHVRLRQWTRRRPLSLRRRRPGTSLAHAASVRRCRRRGHDYSRPGRYHRRFHRISGRRLGRRHGRGSRHFLARVPGGRRSGSLLQALV